MAQQTAVEWLQEIELKRGLSLADWMQAKRMEKEQIENSFKDGVYEGVLTDINYLNCDEDAEFYYNSRYK